jgi:hypothetical protein
MIGVEDLNRARNSTATLAHHFNNHGYRTYWQDDGINEQNIFRCSLLGL